MLQGSMLGQLESTTKSLELNLVREPKSGCISIFNYFYAKSDA